MMSVAWERSPSPILDAVEAGRKNFLANVASDSTHVIAAEVKSLIANELTATSFSFRKCPQGIEALREFSLRIGVPFSGPNDTDEKPAQVSA